MLSKLILPILRQTSILCLLIKCHEQHTMSLCAILARNNTSSKSYHEETSGKTKSNLVVLSTNLYFRIQPACTSKSKWFRHKRKSEVLF